MTEEAKARPLGRGLSSLLGPQEEENIKAENSILYVGIYELCPGKYQPRRYFDQENLESLVQSIKEKGVIQPILVRPTQQALANYEIIAGERRWQAARRAGLTEVPVIIREMNDLQAMETGLIENIQRHDLTPLEEAEGYKRLLEEFNYTQEELSKTLGKSRSHIANQLRLLNLPDEVKEMVERGLLTSGHAKAIAGHENVRELAQRIVKQGLNVRQAEKLAQKMLNPVNDSKKENGEEIVSEQQEDIQRLEEMLSEALKMQVALAITRNDKKMTIRFKNMQELEALIERLT